MIKFTYDKPNVTALLIVLWCVFQQGKFKKKYEIF